MTLLKSIEKAFEITPGFLAIIILFLLSINTLTSKEIKTKLDLIKIIVSSFLIIISLLLQVKASLKTFFIIQELRTKINCIEKKLNNNHFYNKKQCKELINYYDKIIKDI